MQPIRIAITGAGPAGLTLARLLQHRTSNNNLFEVKVYEKDASRNARQQGGSLDLHPRAGLLALEQAGLTEQFLAKARPEGEDLRILDKHDKVHINHVAEEGKIQRPEIDRTDLRNLLLDATQPNTVQWGHKLLEVSPSKAAYAMKFDNGRGIEADIVVGAEGAWSKVRNFVTNTKPVYTGISMVEMSISDIDNKHPELAKYIGRGSVFVFSDGKSIQLQRNNNGTVRVYAGMTVPPTWVAESGIKIDEPDTGRPKLLEHFADWTSPSVEFIRKCDDNFMTARGIYALPVTEESETEREGEWPMHHEGVTLIGDAAHLTGPSGGGVNCAMLDALELATFLIGMPRCETAADRTREIALALRAFQKGLFVRGREAEIMGEKVMNAKYAPDSPAPFVALAKAKFKNEK